MARGRAAARKEGGRPSEKLKKESSGTRLYRTRGRRIASSELEEKGDLRKLKKKKNKKKKKKKKGARGGDRKESLDTKKR